MISICIIAKNEERWLPDFFENIKKIGSEIIFVDTGSTDRSKDLAKTAGAKVFDFMWTGHFSEARNFSLSKATQPWILILDPDERIADSDISNLKNLTKDTSTSAYQFISRNYCNNPYEPSFVPCTKEYPGLEKDYLGFTQSKKLRLFRNDPQTKFVGAIHEIVDSTIRGEILETKIPVHHYGTDKKVFDSKEKASLYISTGMQKLKENPESFKAHFELGVLYLGTHKIEEAIATLEVARKLDPSSVETLSNLGYAYLENKNFEKSREILDHALQLKSDDHSALINRALVEVRTGNLSSAIKQLTSTIKLHPHSFVAYRILGNIFLELQEFEAAEKAIQQALAIFPNFSDAKKDLESIHRVRNLRNKSK